MDFSLCTFWLCWATELIPPAAPPKGTLPHPCSELLPAMLLLAGASMVVVEEEIWNCTSRLQGLFFLQIWDASEAVAWKYAFVRTELCASWRPSRTRRSLEQTGDGQSQANSKNHVKNQSSEAEKPWLASSVVSREAWRQEMMRTAV